MPKADLYPIPFSRLLRRMRGEVEVADAIFDLPVRKWFVHDGELDFSARHFSRQAGAPVGPAAGPHTQLAQNIVLAWLAGGRIIELKTVQVNDRLEIPRPCIHAPNLAFNVEWSQELAVRDSLKEYAKAAYLIEILKKTRAFGVFPGDAGLETIFDMSVGYDLEGIRSEKVVGFIQGLREPAPLFDELRAELTGELAGFADMELPPTLSDCVTLSTFHGCPADQIESIARFLMEEMGLQVVIKLNPTLLGFEEIDHLLRGRLGYEHLRADPFMYLSGLPLHVISMTLMQRFRESLGFDFPVSFSAGIDARNFPAAVACGMVPVTTCTDLLRQGGYGRLPPYLRALAREMEAVGVRTREAYVLAARGLGAEAVEEAIVAQDGGEGVWVAHGEELRSLAKTEPDGLPGALRKVAASAGFDAEALVLAATRVAGRLNAKEIVTGLPDDERYHAARALKPPKEVDSFLGLYDCLNCDLCVSACPNNAIFAYSPEPLEAGTVLLQGGDDGVPVSEAGQGFQLREGHQLAVYGGSCNECSNCEVYCPEQGAPFREKELVFPSMEAFSGSDTDGFYREGDLLSARLGGREMTLSFGGPDEVARLTLEDGWVEVEWSSLRVMRGYLGAAEPGLDTAILWRMKTVLTAIYGSPTPNPVNPDGV